MKKWLLSGLCFAIALCVQAATPPTELLNGIAQQILTVLKTHQSELASHPTLIYQCVEKQLLKHVDIEGMSRSVLGRDAWYRATPAERKAFSQAFSQLVIHTYATPLAKYQGETIRFYPIRGGEAGRFVRVESEIVRPNSQAIPLAYNLVRKQDAWKIYDMSVEGVSLLQSYRTQFEAALQHDSLPALIEKMKQNTRTQAAS